DQRPPGLALSLRDTRIAVSGQVDENELVIDAKEVDLACSPTRVTDAGELSTADHAIQQGRLSDVRPSRKRDFGEFRRRSPPAGRSHPTKKFEIPNRERIAQCVTVSGAGSPTGTARFGPGRSATTSTSSIDFTA